MHAPERQPRQLSYTAIRSAVADLIRRDEITIVFQPIVDLTRGRVAGYEALTRPERSTIFEHAGQLFEAAERVDMFAQVEGIARRRALRAAAEHHGDCLIFINNSPQVFTSEDFAVAITEETAAHGVSPQRIVLEITERTAQGLIGGLACRSKRLQAQGFEIALDDVGAGISGLNQIMALRPNWMKLDIELISDIDVDPLKQNLIRFFVHFAKLSNMKLVAEGIERDEELRVLVELGVSYGQGFLLGRPGVLGAELAPDMQHRLDELRGQNAARRLAHPGELWVSELATAVPVCDCADPVGAVGERLRRREHQRGVVVQDGPRYVGWIPREKVLDAAGALAPSVRIGAIPVQPSPLVDMSVTLDDGLEIVAALPEEHQLLPLVLHDNGQIIGTVSLRELLLAAADAQRRLPAPESPVIGLPGRAEADRWLAHRIAAGDPCHIAFIDIREFDAYNVAYGFDKGDAMLGMLVALIQELLVDVEHGASYVAHLGEDRFLVAFPRDARSRLVALAEAFMRSHPAFFSAADLANGVYRRIHALTTIRIVYRPNALLDVVDTDALHAQAGEIRLRDHEIAPDGAGAVAALVIVDEGGARRRSA